MADSTRQASQSNVATIGVVVTAVALAALAFGVLRIATVLEQREDPITVVEHAAGVAAELLIEEGFATSRLDPDEPLLGLRTIVVAEAINERTARHVIERLLYLNELDPDAPIDLLITTNGGWKDSAFAIIDVMERIDAPVNTAAVGGCYSAGSMLLVAGTGERTATPHTLMSIHAYPDLEDLEPFDLDPLDQRRFRELYLRRSRTPAEFFDVPDESQPYFDAEQALDWGIIDRIANPRSGRGREPARPDRPDQNKNDQNKKRAAELREARRPEGLADKPGDHRPTEASRVGV